MKRAGDRRVLIRRAAVFATFFALLVLGIAGAAAQTGNGPAPAAPASTVAAQTGASSEPNSAKKPSSSADICQTIQQAAAEYDLPVQFFARVIWQESRFNARAVSNKGAEGIAQFMPQTSAWRGLADPFDPKAALHYAASYLHDLRKQFGNLGLAAAGYNAGPGRVSGWLNGARTLPAETRNYVATITGWTADEWASPSPPKLSQTTIPQGFSCGELANLILAPPHEAKEFAGHVPRWGAQLAASWSEARAWATYRALQRRFVALIGDREPVVLRGRLPGMGRRARFMIRIGGDSRDVLEKFCNKLIAAGGACVVLRNQFPPAVMVGRSASG
jgi:Transglycosylase SLT domain